MPRFTQEAIVAATNAGIALPPTSGDTTAPTISSISATSGNYRLGTTIDFTVTFSEALTTAAIGGSTLGLTVGSTARTATQVAATSTTVTYRYTVQSGDNDADGIAITALNLNGATIRDAAGNAADLSVPSASQTAVGVLLDTTAPVAPSVDDITDDDTINIEEAEDGFQITGTAEAGSVVKIEDDDGNVVGTTVADQSGDWVITVAPEEVELGLDETVTLTVTSTDAAGNSTSTTHALTLDTVAPTTPTFATVADDDTINIAEATEGFTVSGEAEDGTVIVLRNGAGDVVGVTTATEGTWSIDIPAGDVDEGEETSETVTVVSTDAAGNETSATKTLTIDTLSPTAPTVDTVADDDTVNATEAEDGFTVSGEAEDGTTIVLRNQAGTTIGTTVADGEGLWSIAVDAADVEAMDQGDETLSVTSTDAAGNSIGITYDITVDTLAPTTPTIDDVTDDNTINAAEATKGFNVTGTAEAGTTIELFDQDGGRVGSATADEDGAWTIAVPTGNVDPDVEETSTITIVSTDAAGNTASETASVTVDTKAPADPVIDDVAGDNTITSAEANAGFNVTGTAEADATVSLKDGSGTLIGETTADGEGVWSIAVDAADVDAMGEGDETLTVTVTDAAGNATDGTVDVTVEANDAPVIANQTTSVNEGEGLGFTVEATAKFGFEIGAFEIMDGDPDGLFAIDNSGALTLNRPLEAEGEAADAASYTLTIKVTNAQIAEETPEFSTATVTVTLTDVNDNDPIITSADAVELSEGTDVDATVIDVDATDADRDAANRALTYAITSVNGGENDGTFAINAATGKITLGKAVNYEALADAGYTYTIGVEVRDQAGEDARIATQTITVTVTDVNEAPTVSENSLLVENDGSTVTISADHLSVADPENQTVTFTFSSIPTNGVLFYNEEVYAGGELNVTAAEIAAGALKFRGDDNTTVTLDLTASDGENTIPVAFEIKVLPTNSAPQLLNFETNTTTLGALAFTEGDTAKRVDSTLTIVDSNTTNFSGGFLKVQSDDTADVLRLASGTKLGVSGTTVTYDADGAGSAASPVTVGTISLGAGWIKVDFTGTTVSRAAALEIAQAVTFLNTSDSVREGAAVAHTLTYTLNDGEEVAKSNDPLATATVTVTGVNDAPVAVNDTASADEQGGTDNDTGGSTPEGNLLTDGTDDSDVDAGDTLTVTLVNSVTADGDDVTVDGETTVAGQYGTLTILADGSYSYAVDNDNADVQALNDDGTLTEVFAYTVSDDSGTETATDTATLTITINGANDAPVNSLEDTDVVVAQGTDLAFNADGENGISVADVDSTTLTVTLGVDHGTLTVTTTGVTATDGDGSDGTLTLSGTAAALNTALQTLVYKSAADYYGADTLTVTTADGGELTATDTVAITVSAKPVNDLNDTIVPDGAYQGAEGSTITLEGLRFTDADAAGTDAFTVTLKVSTGTGDISAAASAGITIDDGATGQVVLSGTYDDLRAYLAADTNLSFVPTQGYNGTSTLTMTTSDGSLSDVDTVSITIVPISNEYMFDEDTGSLTDDNGSDIASDTIYGFAVTDSDLGGIIGQDTLTISNASAADATVTVVTGAGGGTTLAFAGGSIFLDNFNTAINDGRIVFDDGSTLLTNTGGAAKTLSAGARNDQLIAGDNGDTLRGGAGDDKLVGGDGRDYLYDGAGTDTVDGGGDSDVIVAGRGDDTFTGGDGADFFVFTARSGTTAVSVSTTGDTITDFSSEDGDKIVLIDVATMRDSYLDLLFSIDNSGDDAIVTLANGTTITVLGVNLTIDDFRGSSALTAVS